MTSNKVSPDFICMYSTSWRGGDGWYTHALAEGIAQALPKFDKRLILVASQMEPLERDASDSNLDRFFFRAAHKQEWSKPKKLIHTILRITEATVRLISARRKASVFIVTFPHWLTVCFLQFLLLKATRASVIYIVHDPLPHAWSFPSGGQWLEKLLLRGTYFLADHLVTLTNSGKDILNNVLSIPKEKLSVIPHGVFNNGKIEAPKSNRTFLIFGMLRSNKCILESIRAFSTLRKKFPDARLVVAGAPYSAEMDYWELCRREIELIGESIHCEIGFVEEARLEELFSQADAVLLPYMNFNSQSGVAMLAALSMRPVIGTAIGGIAELFELGMCGIPVDSPPTEEKITAAMVQFCDTNTEAWTDATIKAREDLLNALSWKRIGEHFGNLADSVSHIRH